MFSRRDVLAGTGAILATGANAQPAWPDRNVRLIIPFPPGGAADLIGRLLAAHLQGVLGRSVVVENRGGAGSSIGVDALAKASDGVTIGMGNIAANAILPALQRGRLPYDPVRDFAPVTNLAVTPCYLAVNPQKLPVTSVAALVDHARQNPDKLNYSSSGVGSSLHLAMELFCQKAGIRMTHVPFNGGSPALQALLGGQVDLMIDTVATSWPQVREGRLRALATTMPARMAIAPDLPALNETYPGTDIAPWHGLLTPANTPPAVVERLFVETTRFLAMPATRERFDGAALEPAPSASPAAFTAFIQAEGQKFAAVITAANIRVE
ncbi:Bug family tripartite tricarboxylate transporter substrate binding protein [Humitalea sp. 24SJ18S-53]|uniref:Bug family tripartite tricarboxylate transporter substrate binding protein n=1 Tax=Humitalea sp. 24SJ18S-53 TaxID=3422307 RepID=UPI003D676871